MNLYDFPDSELLYPLYLPEQQILAVHIRLWNDKNACLFFNETIAVNFMSYSDPIGVRIGDMNSDYARSILKREYDRVPQNHEFVCYEFIDDCDSPFVMVIAKNICYLEERLDF